MPQVHRKNLIKFIDKNNNEVCLIGRNLKKIKFKNNKYRHLQFKISINEIKKFNPEILIHLAWAGYPEVGKKYQRKILMVKKIFLTYQSEGLKKFTTGSCFEYGNLDGQCKENKKITRFSFF